MNLLCPNCQKPLTVPEQYAGQPMRCPLCTGTFTVPALAPSAVPPAPDPAQAPPNLAASAAPDTYGLRDPIVPPPAPHVSDLAFQDLTPTSRGPSTGGGGPQQSPSGPTAFTEGQPSFPSTPTPEGYQRKYTIWFSPRVLQYVAPAALCLILVLTFFPWVGVYPGGVADAWQNAWQATVGGYSFDSDVVVDKPPFPKDAEPGWNILLIFYLVVFVLTLLIALGCLTLVYVPHSKLPPAATPVLPWRWGIVAALNLILLLFLILQMFLGFSLENRKVAATDSEVAAQAQNRPNGVTTTAQARQDAIARGEARHQLKRTIWLYLVVFFHVVAVLGAGLIFCINRRGVRPAPRIDLLW